MKQGWEIKKLREIAEYFNGLTYSPKDVSNEGTIVLRSSNIQNDDLDFSDIVRVNANVKEKLFVKDGDILMCSRNGSQRLVGKTAAISNLMEPMTFGTFMMIIRSEFGSFLLWFFKTDEFKKQISGGENTMINQVTRYMLDEIEIPLPPLPEQQRIVAILDEAFAAIAKAKANAEQNLKNAKALFESYLQGVFENGNWETKEFGEVITTLTDYHANGSYEILKENVELKEAEDFAWMVRSTDFENNFENNFRYTDEKGYNFLSKSKVFGGEIIMSKIGNAGNVYLMPKVYRPCSLAMNLFLIKLDEKKAIPEYTFQYLKSKEGEIQIKSRLLGMATKTITKDNVRNIIIPFPPIKEQQTIVQKLDALSAETKKLEAIYQQKIDDLQELKKSVLQKAFSGELKT